jgi:glycosyltransferase involved in cell wall biosynthesis
VQLVRAFEGRYRHTVVALNGCYDMAAQMPDGAPLLCRDSNVGGGLNNIPAMRRFIAAAAPDVLVTYNWGSVEWATANRLFPLARHIHIEDGFGPEERNRQIPRRVWFRKLALSGRHTTVILPSRTLLKIATEQWRLRPESLRYIVNGIDCERFAATPRPAGPVTIGTVASLRREKNLQRLIRGFAAASRLRPDLKLMIVGDGPERVALEAVAADAGCAAQVEFTGATTTPEHFFARMHVFAMSSDTEQMPLGVLEAMAAGLPVAATDVGDIKDMIVTENRRFVTPLTDDDAGLARSFVELADNPALRQALGQANRQKALAEYHYRQMAAKYAELFG